MVFFNKCFPPRSGGNFRTQYHWDENILKQTHLWGFSATLILNIWAAFCYLTTLCALVLTAANVRTQVCPSSSDMHFLDTISCNKPWSKKHKCQLQAMKQCFKTEKEKTNPERLVLLQSSSLLLHHHHLPHHDNSDTCEKQKVERKILRQKVHKNYLIWKWNHLYFIINIVYIYIRYIT